MKITKEKTSEVPPPTQKLYCELKKVWDDSKDDHIILAAKLDNFVGTSLYRALLNGSEIVGSRIPKRKVGIVKKSYNNNKNKNKRTDRNPRRRYLYVGFTLGLELGA